MSLKESLVSEHLLLKNKERFPQISELRELGIQAFEQRGFPTSKNEEWKYTPLSNILQKNYATQHKEEASGVEYKEVKQYFVHDIDSYKIVFLNGKYSSFLSDTTHDEADICILSSAMQQEKYFTVLENYLGKIAPTDEYFVDLNTAYLTEGAYIHIHDNTYLSKPIQIVYLYNDKAEESFYQARNLVVVGNNCKVQIIERYQTLNDNTNFINVTTEVHLGTNSFIDWNKVQNDTLNSSLIDQTYISQEKDSTASFHTFSFGGKLTRNTLEFTQNGENCNSILKGITIAGEEQVIDHHTQVKHMQAHCESHELYRYILNDNSKGVFNGKIWVDKEAQQLNAFQQNNCILLSDNASVDTKPQLEIFADDVKCSHGCTVGQLDDDALFYLQSRGIPRKEAEALLLYGFANDVLESVSISPLKEKIFAIIAEKLGVNIEF